MKIKTVQFGVIEFDEDRIIRLPEGILGFEDLRDYLFIKTDDELFYWLTSIDKPDIVFPLVALKMLDSGYVEKPDSEAFGIVKLDKEPGKITVNMRAPVYINQESKEGFQIILEEEKYPVSYKLFTEEPGNRC
jgi:flagellar assembly factor FliW